MYFPDQADVLALEIWGDIKQLSMPTAARSDLFKQYSIMALYVLEPCTEGQKVSIPSTLHVVQLNAEACTIS